MRLYSVFLEEQPDNAHLTLLDELHRVASAPLQFTIVKPAIGRYTVPALCGFGDLALFIDPACPFRGDVVPFWKQATKVGLFAVYLLKEERQSAGPTFMLFRNKFCQRLTIHYAYENGAEALHPAIWAGGEDAIGTLERPHATV